MQTEIYDFNKKGRSHKSIGVEEIIEDALLNNINYLSVISSGNYIRTIVEEVKSKGLEDQIKVINLVNKLSGAKDYQELEIEDNRILRDAKERESFILDRYNISNVKDYTDFIPRQYFIEAEKILQNNPDYVSVGIGSGKLFLSLIKKIKERSLDTKVIGIVPRNENGIFNENNIYEVEGKLYYKQFNPKTLADKLACPYTFYKPEILESQESGHILIEADNNDFKKANKIARKLGINAEFSGSAGFVINDPKIRERYGIKNNSRIVVVNTGRGYFWENQLRREKRNMLIKIISPIAAAASLVIGGLLYDNKPSPELLAYADLNSDGRITNEKIVECNMIAGICFDKDYKFNEKKYQELIKNPSINNKTLLRIKNEKQRLLGMTKEHFKDIDNVNKVLSGLGGKVRGYEELSFDQMRYLNSFYNKAQNINPEMWSCMTYCDWYKRLIQTQRKEA